jgi:hypothetical protein
MPIARSYNSRSSSLWVYRRSMVVAVLLVVVGPDRPDHDHFLIALQYILYQQGCQIEFS